MIKFYEAPSVEVMDVAVEQGFAATLENFTYDEEELYY